MIGDWMGSLYDTRGQRFDYRLFLDHDGSFEQTVRREPDYEKRIKGRWFHDEAQGVLRLESDAPAESEEKTAQWWVLSVRTCEDSNCILVLRLMILGSRNLPVLLYRVHCDDRGYGTNWKQKLDAENPVS